MTYQEFFKLLGNPDPICLIDNKLKISVNEINKYNKKYDIYFIPNIGGTKSKDITDFKAFFVDLDCGRDENNNYYSLNKVRRFKESCLAKIDNFEIKPNVVVETRNGLHAYWFIYDKIDYGLWAKIENAFVEHFNSDKKVKSPANQMRVPNTFWMKDKDNPFFCKIVRINDVKNYIASYCTMLKNEKNEIPASKSKISMIPKYKSQYKRKIFKSYKEVFDFITKSVSMFDYLKKYYNLDAVSKKSFCCIFHTDEKASADIFKTDSGIELYYCHSANCGFTGNLIQVVAKLEDCSRSKAINKICENLNVKYEENIETMKFLLDNIKTIDDDIQYSHKDLYGVIYRYLPTLRALHFIALKNIIYADNEKDLIFSVSTNYVAKALGKNDKKNTGADISLFCLLKLIDKIDLDDDTVSECYKQYIKRFQGDRDKYVNVYSIPQYSYDKLSECNEMAKQVKEKNLRKKHFTYESVANAFGTDTADRVFPQVKGKRVRDIDEYLLYAIETLLEKYGYFTENSVREFYRVNDNYFKENTFIKQIPAIMQDLGLKKVKASKLLKRKYNILSSGYPYLYIKR